MSGLIVLMALAIGWCQGARQVAIADELPAPQRSRGATAPEGWVDRARVRTLDQEKGIWPLSGRDVGGTFYSPLTQINAETVGALGFAWEFKTGGYRTLEATPIVVDGLMFTSGNWGAVYALDATSGRLMWQFDPYADGRVARRPGVDVVNRGIALWHGMVFVSSLDCRAVALDARTGKIIWSVRTTEDPRYLCTGAPLVADGVVVFGNGGSDQDTGGLRGYVSAYDVATGKFRWRTYTVPKPGDPHPSPEMKAAEASWDPGRDYSFGGGGTVWNGMAYDVEAKRVYVGTGNAAPYVSRREIGGRALDRLHAASILALDGSTGRIVWHFQATPGDMWDFDATAPLILADLSVAGELRKAVLQANKNGYFYVLDRTTGHPISARPFAFVSWSTGMDENYRPLVTAEAADASRPRINYPGTLGAHNWAPMSFSRRTGLVYVPAVDTPSVDVNLRGESPAGGQSASRRVLRGTLKAWNPVEQRLAWEQPTSDDHFVRQGGALSTAGKLVIAGREDGSLVAYADDTGAVLQLLQTGAATIAAPMTYEVDGVQYIAVMQGLGGAYTYTLEAANQAHYLDQGRILVLRLGGGSVPRPASAAPGLPAARPPGHGGTAAQIALGRSLFNTWCAKCHAGASSEVPDRGMLERGISDLEIFKAIVMQGALVPRGMARFNDVLSAADVEAVRAFLVSEAWAADRGEGGASRRP
jgi:quinohemoprotein ethanol dehydrogenase